MRREWIPFLHTQDSRSAQTFLTDRSNKIFKAIFDAPGKKAQLAKTEQQISDPDFWNQPEKSQKVMQDRKRLEQTIADAEEVARLTSDLDTLFELAGEGEDVAADLEREIRHFEERLETLETGMLLSGRNDSKSAIMAIHPGAGGTVYPQIEDDINIDIKPEDLRVDVFHNVDRRASTPGPQFGHVSNSPSRTV